MTFGQKFFTTTIGIECSIIEIWGWGFCH